MIFFFLINCIFIQEQLRKTKGGISLTSCLNGRGERTVKKTKRLQTVESKSCSYIGYRVATPTHPTKTTRSKTRRKTMDIANDSINRPIGSLIRVVQCVNAGF